MSPPSRASTDRPPAAATPKLDRTLLDATARNAARLARFAAPDPRIARRAREIRRSGAFDRRFYVEVNPGLHPLFRRFPERHYLLFGEAAGLRPSAAFSPGAYLALNPDLGPIASPLLHYLREGRAQGRPATEPEASLGLPPALCPSRAPPGAPFAAVVHVYYPELWGEIRDALRACGLPFDLFVTVADRGAGAQAVADAIAAEWPGARVIAMPNRGRDILPFVHLVNAGLLAPHRAVCKLHTKRSPHRRDGDAWRRTLIAALLDPDRTRGRLDAFLADDAAGVWIADGQIYAGRGGWGLNEARALALLRRIGIEADGRALRFPGGSMYWIKPEILARIRALELRPEEFEVERTQLDGTLAHAFERALGYVATAGGGSIREASTLDAAARGRD